MLKVLHVMGRMAAGGTERQLLGMLSAAHGVHWDATLCTLRPGSPLITEVHAAGIPLVELGGTSKYDARGVASLRGLLRSGRFDVVHSSLWGCNVATRAAALGTRRPPIVISERSVEGFRSNAGRAIDRALRHRTAAYIGNSVAVAAFVEEAHGAPAELVTVIPNGIDTQVFRPAERAPVNDRPRVGAVGRLIDAKGFDTLVQAASHLAGVVDLEVVIAGEGPLRGDLEQAARGLPVTFVGQLPGSRAVASFLQGLDVFVMPSRWEGYPNALLEARACTLPLVVTDAPGVGEAVVGVEAVVVPVDDARALADGIARQVTSPMRPAPGGALSFDDVARLHLDVFRRAFEGSRR